MRGSGFNEYFGRSLAFRSVVPSDSLVYPITYHVPWDSLLSPHVMRFAEALEKFGSADWCYTMDVESVVYGVGFYEDLGRFVGIAELQGHIVEDHLFSEEGNVSIFASHSEVPGKVLYTPGHWGAGKFVGRRVLVSGRFERGFLHLTKETVLFIEADGTWRDQFGRRIEEQFIREILQRRQDATDLKRQFARSDVVLIARAVSDISQKMETNGEGLELSVEQVLKGQDRKSIEIFRYSDPWSNVNLPRFYPEVDFLLFLTEAGDGRLILEGGQNSAFGIIRGDVTGSSGFGFANLDSLKGTW